jgi:dienelactone hydrolase
MPLLSTLTAALVAAQVWDNPAAGDPAKQMVDGIYRFLEKQRPSQGGVDLARILGVIDPRVKPGDLELVASLNQPALRASTAGFDAYAVRWPVLEGLTAEGLLLQPKTAAISKRIVAIPDAGMPPERMTAMQKEASGGAQVLIPVLIDRASKWAGNPALRKNTNQSHREFVYRMAFPFGRHLLGYELQKVLAAVDWFSMQTPAGAPIQVIGFGEGASLAAYAKALDARIDGAYGAGFAWDRSDVAGEPIDRNVWKIRLAAVEPTQPYSFLAGNSAIPAAPDADARMRRQFDELIRLHQRLIAKAERVREERWNKAADKNEVRRQLWEDVLGRIPKSNGPLNIRRKTSYESAKWTGYEIQFDVVAPEVFGYGVLLLPKDLKAGEKRPVVVVQHGLEGRPQDLFQQKAGREFDTYRNLAESWADLGYIVYAPQNPYRGDFRRIVREANPLGLSLFSFVLAQYEKMFDFLDTLPEVDRDRIGFYGLSYGGKTAMYIPALLPRFKGVVCSGNFNEWIHKLVSYEHPYTYLFTTEYEIFEFGLANVAGHAEMAKLIAPVPFLVERGHRDGVGVDEWVSYEYGKVKRYYDENGWNDRVGIAWFNGPHRIDGVEAIPFLRKWLGL